MIAESVRSNPQKYSILQYTNMSPDDPFRPEEGDVYVDGSCSNPSFPSFSLAAFAAVQMHNGQVHKIVRGNVPRSLPQTPLMAEACGLSIAFQLASPNVTLALDCKYLVDSFHNGITSCLHYSNKTCCTWKGIQMQCNTDSMAVRKVKAHRSIEEVSSADPQDMVDFVANDLADQNAKLAINIHDQDPHQVTEFLNQASRLRKIARHAADVLSNWPFVKRSCRSALIRSEFASVGAPIIRHKFVWHKKAWWCVGCFRRTNNLHSLSIPPACDETPLLASLLTKHLNHTLWVARIKPVGFIIYCSVCWSYAEYRVDNLSRPCCGPPIKGPSHSFAYTARKRILNRCHPFTLLLFAVHNVWDNYLPQPH